MFHIEDVNYMVSLYCPGQCANCNIWRLDKQTVRKNEMELALFERVLQSEALKETGYFDFTAGESQLSPKYVPALELIGKYKPEAFVHTNISGWYPETHEKVVQEGLQYLNPRNFRIDVSLDGSRESYEKVRLVKNGFDKLMETIKCLKPLGIRLRATMIVYRETYKDIPWLVEFAKENGMEYFIGYARNASLLNNMDRPYEYTEKELQEIEDLLTKVGWLDDRRRPNWLWAKSIYQKQIPEFNCFMGQRALVIDPYGSVFPCNDCLEMLNMGNLKEFDGDLDTLLASEQAQQVIEKVQNRTCQPCSMLCAHKIEFPWGKQTGMQKTKS